MSHAYNCNRSLSHHRCKNVFYVFFIYFYKKRVLTFFLFLERFSVSSGEILYSTKPAKILLNLLNSCIKRLLSDEFNMAAITNSLMKSRIPQTLSCNFTGELFIWFD